MVVGIAIGVLCLCLLVVACVFLARRERPKAQAARACLTRREDRPQGGRIAHRSSAVRKLSSFSSSPFAIAAFPSSSNIGSSRDSSSEHSPEMHTAAEESRAESQHDGTCGDEPAPAGGSDCDSGAPTDLDLDLNLDLDPAAAAVPRTFGCAATAAENTEEDSRMSLSLLTFNRV